MKVTIVLLTLLSGVGCVQQEPMEASGIIEFTIPDGYYFTCDEFSFDGDEVKTDNCRLEKDDVTI